MEFEIVKAPSRTTLREARMKVAELLMVVPTWKGEQIDALRERILQKLCHLEPEIAEEVEIYRGYT